jgi:topoisomerase IV subunit A
LMGKPDTLFLIASDAGYGFVTKLDNMYCKNKAGKSFLKCPAGAKPLAPQIITNTESQYIASISNEGRLLVFPIAELPELPRGKGNKIISIPSKRVEAREEFCIGIAVLNEKDALTLHSGKRHITLKPKDLANFQGERGRRGNKLPRGFRKVDRLTVAD